MDGGWGHHGIDLGQMIRNSNAGVNCRYNFNVIPPTILPIYSSRIIAVQIGGVFPRIYSLIFVQYAEVVRPREGTYQTFQAQ